MLTTEMVKELRERTGCGMMDCKKALQEADCNMEKAIEWLREKGLAAATKKAGRIAAEGIVEAYKEGGTAALIEVNSETDFVSKNEEFKSFVTNVAKIVAKDNPADVPALLALKYTDGNLTVEEALREKILTIGENINIRRFERYEGYVATYIHGGGRIGVMVKFAVSDSIKDKPEVAEITKDIAMQVAAAFPQYLDRSTVPTDALEKEKEILTVQARNEGKPENIIEKMVMGRINKFYQEVCLVDQAFIKDNDVSVAKMLENAGKELGGTIVCEGFHRFEKGEGLQKREDDFAAEVEKMTNK